MCKGCKGCKVCDKWARIEPASRREPASVAGPMINEVIGMAYKGRDAAKTLATCPGFLAALKARERMRAG